MPLGVLGWRRVLRPEVRLTLCGQCTVTVQGVGLSRLATGMKGKLQGLEAWAGSTYVLGQTTGVKRFSGIDLSGGMVAVFGSRLHFECSFGSYGPMWPRHFATLGSFESALL